jgi:phosphatidylethanolamine-binding protein (PEBP) family uncharacterized protein
MKKIRTGFCLLTSLALLLLFRAPVWAADAPETILVSSTAFAHNEDMPLRYTAYGENVSPELSWRNLPEGTRQLALVLDDPVFGMPAFVHWVAYNIPVSATGLPRDSLRTPS